VTDLISVKPLTRSEYDQTVRRAVVQVNIDPAGTLTVGQLERARAALQGAGFDVIATDLERFPPTERQIELLQEGDDPDELRHLAEAACASAVAAFAPRQPPRATSVSFMSSGSYEDALAIVRAFGLDGEIEELTFVDDDVAVLVLAREAPRRGALAKVQTALECALNREIQLRQCAGLHSNAVAESHAEGRVGIREQRKRATREELLQAASEMFAERGYDNVTVAEIAAGAGVSVKTLFQHFRSKEDLLLAELDAVHEGLLTALRTRDREQTPLEALTEWMLTRVENSPPDAMERWQRTVGSSQAVASLRRRLYDQWENAIVRVLADEANEARPSPRTRLIAAQLVAMVRVTSSPEVREFVGQRSFRDRRAAYREWIQQAADLIANGISRIE
jgi:AcrR family transcriptional regulator